MIENMISMDRYRMYCIATMVDNRMMILNPDDENVPFYPDMDSAYIALNDVKSKDSPQVFYICELELDTYISAMDKNGNVIRISPSAGIKIIETFTKVCNTLNKE